MSAGRIDPSDREVSTVMLSATITQHPAQNYPVTKGSLFPCPLSVR